MSDFDFKIHPAWQNFSTGISLSLMAFFCAIYSKLFISSKVVPDQYVYILGAMGFLLMTGVLVRRYSTSYFLKNRQIISQSGLLARHETSLRIKDIRAINLHQSFSGRLMNIGDISFSSAAQSDSDIIFKGVDNPKALRDQLNRLLHSLDDTSA